MSRAPSVLGSTPLTSARAVERSSSVGRSPGTRARQPSTTSTIPFSVNQDFEDQDSSTKLTVVGEGEPGGLFKLAEPIVGKAAERQLIADFETLKDLLEARQ
jgi:hypothetical protein